MYFSKKKSVSEKYNYHYFCLKKKIFALLVVYFSYFT